MSITDCLYVELEIRNIEQNIIAKDRGEKFFTPIFLYESF